MDLARSWFCLALACAFILSQTDSVSYALTRDFVTGQDWTERMSEREKYIALTPPAILFSEYDVHMKLGLPQYILLIDKLMERNPRLQDEEVSNIFASTIYLFEPENRGALRTMETDFLRGDFESSPIMQPRLTIEDVLPEAVRAES